MRTPRISFGIIVLNGQPFVRYCLRSLYPFAYEIIVVEGGHKDTRSVATPDGHSVDGTLEELERFKREDDPEDKVRIVVRDGFWPKMEGLGDWRTYQSRAYAERATGDYLWQVDVDEFYKPGDMETVLKMLLDDPSIAAVSFKTYTFWGREDVIAGSWALQHGQDIYHRLFKWGPGYHYVSHEPPTVHDDQGQDLRSKNWARAEALAKRNIFMYHCSLLFPWQVEQKTRIYQAERPELCQDIVEWAKSSYFSLGHPFRVHNLYKYPSWLEKYQGTIPPEIVNMMQDIRSGRVKALLRPMDDADALLKSKRYAFGRAWLKCRGPLYLGWERLRGWMRRARRDVISQALSWRPAK